MLVSVDVFSVAVVDGGGSGRGQQDLIVKSFHWDSFLPLWAASAQQAEVEPFWNLSGISVECFLIAQRRQSG